MAVVYLTYSFVAGTMLILTKIPSRLPTDLLNAFVMSCMIFLPSASVVGAQNWTVTTSFAGAASAALAPVPASAAPAAVAPAACRNVRRLSVVPVLMCAFLLLWSRESHRYPMHCDLCRATRQPTDTGWDPLT